VCFAENPPGLEDTRRVLRASLGRYGWSNARVAHSQTYTVDANWKLATKNYQECYLCAPAHGEFSRWHATDKPDQEVAELRAAAAERARAIGIEIPDVAVWPVGAPGQEMADSSNDATYPGPVTGSEDSQPVAPLDGRTGTRPCRLRSRRDQRFTRPRARTRRASPPRTPGDAWRCPASVNLLRILSILRI
jgi:Rieske 2Fe-2S family protein